MSTLAALSLVLALLPMATLAPGGTFTDDDGHVLEGGIEGIAADGITFGCNPPFNDHYCPDQVLTRAQMAAMVSRGLDLPQTDVDFFIDDNGHNLEGAINRVAAAGITLGCNPPANDHFCPDDPLTRAQAAGFLARALHIPASAVDHFTDDDGHVLEGAINRIADKKITIGCNPPANDHFCPDDGLTRAQVAGMLTRALGLTPTVPPARPALGWDLVVDGLSSPVQVLGVPGESRLLVAQQNGLILNVEGGSVTGTFLDLTGTVLYGGERGLLSMALHPDFPADRRIFVWYSAPLRSGATGNHTAYLAEYDVAPDLRSASSPRIVLAVDEPYSNHNGGMLGFGPDGYLYLGLGDGGYGNDPGGRARDLSTLLGKMIRIDVDNGDPYGIPADNPYVGASGRDEIWASGLRNPWRWTIDDGYMYIGDVGQAAREEVDVVPLEPVGYDFGWSRYEGNLCNSGDTDPSCSKSGLTMPVLDYGRSVGTTVTGGVVYRGSEVRALSRYYIYADVGSGMLRGFRLLDGNPVENIDLFGELGLSTVVDLANDESGHLFAVSYSKGSIYQLTGG